METTKMSLVNIQGKLSRAEMKNIMAGSGTGGSCKVCQESWCKGLCYCSSGLGQCGSTCSGSC
jgi:hypothetical protein